MSAKPLTHRWKHEVQIASLRRRPDMTRAVLPKTSEREQWLQSGLVDRTTCHWTPTSSSSSSSSSFTSTSSSSEGRGDDADTETDATMLDDDDDVASSSDQDPATAENDDLCTFLTMVGRVINSRQNWHGKTHPTAEETSRNNCQKCLADSFSGSAQVRRRRLLQFKTTQTYLRGGPVDVGGCTRAVCFVW